MCLRFKHCIKVLSPLLLTPLLTLPGPSDLLEFCKQNGRPTGTWSSVKEQCEEGTRTPEGNARCKWDSHQGTLISKMDSSVRVEDERMWSSEVHDAIPAVPGSIEHSKMGPLKTYAIDVSSAVGKV